MDKDRSLSLQYLCYCDPVAGIFLSADTKEGNAQGMNPYAYVAQNPETLTDPSGQMIDCGPGCGNGGGGNPTPPPPPPPDHGPTCGPDPSCYGGGKSGPSHLSCGQGTHQAGSQCVSNITCGQGTILEGSTCVSEQDSKDSLYREKVLHNLLVRAIIEELAGYGLSILGDILVILDAGDSVVERLEAIVDLSVTLATGVIPTIGRLYGKEPAFLAKTAIGLMALGSVAQGIFAALNGANWWEKTALDVMALATIDGASGPMAVLQAGLSLFLEPIIGNLLDMGGHALIAVGLADDLNYTNQMNMPIQEWCTQYGGCPAES